MSTEAEVEAVCGWGSPAGGPRASTVSGSDEMKSSATAGARVSLPGGGAAATGASWAAAASVLAAPIDPDLADTAAFCDRYGVEMTDSANCVVIAGRRGDVTRYAACVVLATTRADVNGVVRKRLDARKASFAPMDEATGMTGTRDSSAASASASARRRGSSANISDARRMTS